ncbi:MAG TPA: pilus assembly protein TadG-related protein [Pirellulales bacterium]|nr:pilus assembly protein TadG-related protein [Pirellulales bacterium]
MNQGAVKERGRGRYDPTRAGKILVAVMVTLPALLGMLAIVIDGNGLMGQSEEMQQATDAAAQAAAVDLLQGGGSGTATATANQYITNYNGSTGASVAVHIPPQEGAYAGNSGFVEVVVTEPGRTFFSRALEGVAAPTLSSRAVAGYAPSTAGAALVVLDPSPAPLALPATIPGVPALPSLPSLIGGLEVLGIGNLQVQGAVLVNTTWGGVDQNGDPAGSGPGPPYGIACTPLISLTRLLATDIRVVGGVDNPANYGSVTAGKSSPLQANRLSVSDPWIDLPVPTMSVDPVNVSDTVYGGVQVTLLPLQQKTLNPGVYDWIEIDSGQVTFNPGVYIVRNVNPITGLALAVLGGQVTAAGTMFYITDNTVYSPDQGTPDNADGSTAPAAAGITTLVPSVVLNIGLPGSTFSAISSPSSPFNGIVIFQRRFDRRPVILVQQQLVGGGSFTGSIYAKWAHVMLVGEGTFNVSVVAGTMRVVELLTCTIAPPSLLPPVQEVFLVE